MTHPKPPRTRTELLQALEATHARAKEIRARALLDVGALAAELDRLQQALERVKADIARCEAQAIAESTAVDREAATLAAELLALGALSHETPPEA